MQEYLKKSLDGYYLQLFEKEFSPVTQTSTSIALDYIKNFKEGKDKVQQPLLICFPNKANFSLWISVLIQLNLFFEDQFYGNAEELNLKPNQLIEIFGAVGQFIRIAPESPNCWKIRFKDSELNLKVDSHKKYIKQTNLKSLNKRKKYLDNKRDFFANRNALSQVFYQNNKNEIFEYNKVTSKILLVAGRGNVKSFKDSLNSIELFEERFSKIFKLDENLIIKPDLEEYINVFNDDFSNKFIDFKNTVNSLIQVTRYDELKNLLKKILEWESITENEVHEFDSILSDYSNTEQRLNHLNSKFPGIAPKSNFGYNLVVINDVLIINNYSNLIQQILNSNIPVIFIYQQRAFFRSDIEQTNKFLDQYTDAYKFIWSYNKYKSLNYLKDIFIDSLDYNLFCSYFSKKIRIKCLSQNEADLLFSKAFNGLKRIESVEIRNINYKYLTPIIFNIRCSSAVSKFINQILIEYEVKLNLMRSHIPEDLFDILTKICNLFRDNFINIKSININNSDLYIYQSHYNSNTFFTPNGAASSRLLAFNKKQIDFTGFPANEFSEQPILKSIFDYHYSTINILAWQIEGKTLFEYLKSRISNGLALENIPINISISDNLILNSIENIDFEIVEKIEIINHSISTYDISENIENVFLSIRNSNFADFIADPNNLNIKTVECNVLHFSDQRFCFLPKDGNKVLIGTENNKGDIQIKKLLPTELQSGMLYFDIDYNVDLEPLLKLGNYNSNERQEITRILNSWKVALLEIASICTQKRIDIFIIFNQIKQNNLEQLERSNPTQSNLNYWMDHTPKLGLKIENLYLIALVSQEFNLSFDMFMADNVYKWRNKVRGLLNSLNASIKRKIQQQFNNQKININNQIKFNENDVDIMINIYQLVSIDLDNGLFIEYSKTRKII